MAAESRPQRPDPAVRSRPSVSKKRKRRTSSSGPGPTDDQRPPPAKQRRTTGTNVRTLQSADAVKHALLAQYYPTTLTLRQYVLSHLPASSRIRRRKVAAVGTADGSEDDPSGVRAQLATLLDTTLVGLAEVPRETAKEQSEDRLQQWIEYSQRDDSHVTLSGGDASATHLQSEIIDFIIWLLFSREKNPSRTPHHLLCDGLRRRSGPRQQGVPSSIQGLHRVFFNERVAAIKQVPWPQLLQILGKSGESMMINLLLDCSVFLPVEAGRGNYYQLSVKDPSTFERKPTDVIFVRSRIFYARAALNARGLVHFGFKHIHSLSTVATVAEVHSLLKTETATMWNHCKTFGLHNAFTSHVDHLKSAQKFQDYTLREAEIFAKFGKTDGNGSRQLDVRVPKRLRGRLEHMIQRLQTRHARCSYSKLLEHYCPCKWN
ncbi:hypothetical protein M406DRAFT_332695 [Cryphonectria parasitica EP155]|uniref:Telomerase reverse transcriptase n=1 Tax=Cryphonectria parasitica (strain ATCC 38755 / EP155) TaxID=660469 RepID=A0A9P4XWR7_CRYP1|nr:uncharacterized protein M406DRAFT_332695 [Cryphonectria parasitica EP155]KAF3762316.1 hypothetical protein M406DRAFT_332695 [Cryphonectria parasitica EP155]